MFLLTKTIYCATIGKVVAYFAAQATCLTVAANGNTVNLNTRMKKGVFQILAPLACVAVLTLAFGFYMQASNGANVYAAERQIVYGDPLQAVNQMMAMSTSNQLTIQPALSTPVSVAETPKLATNLDTVSQIEQPTSTYMEAVGLYIDGNFIGAVANHADLDFMLQDLLNNNAPETYQSISFADDVQTKADIFPVSSVMSVDALKAQVTGLSAKPIGYQVAQGDTWDSLAEKFGTTSNELKALNPNVSSPLKEGRQLSVIVKKSLLNVSVVKEETYEKDVDFETDVQKDDSQYTYFSQVKTEGENGKAICVDAVTYVNGKETGRSNTSTTITQEPVTKVVVEGTKTPPDGSVPGESSGTLTWPLPTVHTISSPFSMRWGSHHDGIDIANGHTYGETIVAADGGTVELAQMDNSGYGLHVIINHGNGRKTQYGHASKLLVKAGDKVAKGQPIALVGNTGNSYGAHLHFEVIQNGTKVNPLNYVTP